MDGFKRKFEMEMHAFDRSLGVEVVKGVDFLGETSMHIYMCLR